MKKVKWLFLSSEINYGSEETSDIRRTFISKDFPYSDETLEAAKREAYNGEYEVYDDGLPEPEVLPTDTERIAQLEEALNMLLSGVTE